MMGRRRSWEPLANRPLVPARGSRGLGVGMTRPEERGVIGRPENRVGAAEVNPALRGSRGALLDDPSGRRDDLDVLGRLFADALRTMVPPVRKPPIQHTCIQHLAILLALAHSL